MAIGTIGFNIVDSINDYLIVQDFDSSEIFIMAWDFTLDPATLPTDRNLTVLSYKLSLLKNLSLDCKNIFLLTDLFTLANEPSIKQERMAGHSLVRRRLITKPAMQ